MSDFQFGDVILRNMYTLFGYGNWTRPGNTQPYLQAKRVCTNLSCYCVEIFNMFTDNRPGEGLG